MVANKTVLIFPSQLGVLKGTFEIVLQDTFQTVLVIVADFFGVGHFALVLLFLRRKLCMMPQFHLFEKRSLHLSWSDVLVSAATLNVEWAATKE